MPKRTRRNRVRNFIILALAAVLLLSGGFILWQWRTIGFILNPDTIRLKPDTRETILRHAGAYVDGGIVVYRLLDDTVEVRAAFDETDSFRYLEARFDAYGVPVKSIPDAARKAEDALSPYLGRDEIKALSFILSTEIPGKVSANTINYTRKIGSLTITAQGPANDIFINISAEEREVSP
jgi:hypothetical protein